MTFYFVYFLIQQHLTLIFIQAYFSVSPTSLIATSPTQSIVKFVKLDLTEGGHHYYILYFYISHLIGEIKWCFTIWFHCWAAWQMTNHPHMLTGFCNPLNKSNTLTNISTQFWCLMRLEEISVSSSLHNTWRRGQSLTAGKIKND